MLRVDRKRKASTIANLGLTTRNKLTKADTIAAHEAQQLVDARRQNTSNASSYTDSEGGSITYLNKSHDVKEQNITEIINSLLFKKNLRLIKLSTLPLPLMAKVVQGLAIKNNVKIEIDLSYKPLEKGEAEIIADMLINQNNVTSLNLTGTLPDKDAWQVITQALWRNASLETLNVSYNNLNDHDMKRLFDSLSEHLSLRYLSIMHNELGPVSLQHLNTLLETNNRLSYVSGINWYNIILIGDSMSGKTSLLTGYFFNSPVSDDCDPTVIDEYQFNDFINDHPFLLTIMDVGGYEAMDRLISHQIEHSHLALLCYAVNKETQFHNIMAHWYPLVSDTLPSMPLMLVGTKTDLHPAIKALDAENIAKEIQANAQSQCSAHDKNSIKQLFHNMVQCFHINMDNPDEAEAWGLITKIRTRLAQNSQSMTVDLNAVTRAQLESKVGPAKPAPIKYHGTVLGTTSTREAATGDLNVTQQQIPDYALPAESTNISDARRENKM